MKPALSLAATCAALGFSRETFYRYVRKPVPAARLLLKTCMRNGPRGRRCWRPEDVQRVVELRQVRA